MRVEVKTIDIVKNGKIIGFAASDGPKGSHRVHAGSIEIGKSLQKYMKPNVSYSTNGFKDY